MSLAGIPNVLSGTPSRRTLALYCQPWTPCVIEEVTLQRYVWLGEERIGVKRVTDKKERCWDFLSCPSHFTPLFNPRAGTTVQFLHFIVSTLSLLPT